MADLFLLAAAAAEHGAEHAEGSSTFTFVVALSMTVLIVLMLVLKVPSLIGSMLDGKIASIKTLLEEAATLRKEAEALKAEYEAKLANAAKDAELMSAAAAEEAKHIVAKAKDDAALLITRRQRMAEDKIVAAGLAAEADLRNRTAEAAARAAGELIAAKHTKAADSALVDQAISAI